MTVDPDKYYPPLDELGDDQFVSPEYVAWLNGVTVKTFYNHVSAGTYPRSEKEDPHGHGRSPYRVRVVKEELAKGPLRGRPIPRKKVKPPAGPGPA